MTDAAMTLYALHEVRRHWGRFLALRTVFIIGGVFAIAMPFVAGLVTTVIFAIILVWIGIIQVIQAFSVTG